MERAIKNVQQLARSLERYLLHNEKKGWEETRRKKRRSEGYIEGFSLGTVSG